MPGVSGDTPQYRYVPTIFTIVAARALRSRGPQVAQSRAGRAVFLR